MSDEGKFYQVSDVVSPRIIKAVTAGCVNEDCKLSARIQETTCAGISRWYDKGGNLQMNDSNRFTVYITCCKCGKSSLVNHKGTILN